MALHVVFVLSISYIYIYINIYIYIYMRCLERKQQEAPFRQKKLRTFENWLTFYVESLNPGIYIVKTSWCVVKDLASRIIWGSSCCCCCCISIKLHLMFVAFGCKWNKINGIALQFVIPITASNDNTSSPPSELLLPKAPIFGISWIEWPCCDTISSILC